MQEDLLLGLPMPLFPSLFLLLASYIFSAFNSKLLSNQHAVTRLTRGSQGPCSAGPRQAATTPVHSSDTSMLFFLPSLTLWDQGALTIMLRQWKKKILLDLQLGEKQPQELEKELSAFIINIQLLIFNVIKPRLPPQPSHQTCRGHTSQNPLDRQFNVPVL